MTLALFIEWAIKSVVIFLIIVAGFAYLTLFERRVLARIQVRIGPNRAGRPRMQSLGSMASLPARRRVPGYGQQSAPRSPGERQLHAR